MSLRDGLDNNNENKTANGRNPLLIVGGFIILGVALVLVIFGGGLFGGVETAVNAPVLEQVPALEAADSSTFQFST
ncbi:MAG: hypothetical protein GY805_19355, partial [Chloroflexi bacterium]|nr:hypothetical protein [Chloroflexota bacterium]